MSKVDVSEDGFAASVLSFGWTGDDVFVVCDAHIDEAKYADPTVSGMIVSCNLDAALVAYLHICVQVIVQMGASRTSEAYFAEKIAIIVDVTMVPADCEDARSSANARLDSVVRSHHGRRIVENTIKD